jgi:hypothetical protein
VTSKCAKQVKNTSKYGIIEAQINDFKSAF